MKLKHFEKFTDTTDALGAATAAVEGKVAKPLKKLLKKLVAKDAQEQLLVADSKLGNAIKEKLNISCVSNTAVSELMRCIRSQAESLIGSLPPRFVIFIGFVFVCKFQIRLKRGQVNGNFYVLNLQRNGSHGSGVGS